MMGGGERRCPDQEGRSGELSDSLDGVWAILEVSKWRGRGVNWKLRKPVFKFK